MCNRTEFVTVSAGDGRARLPLKSSDPMAGAAGIEMIEAETSAQSRIDFIDWIERLKALPYFIAMPGF